MERRRFLVFVGASALTAIGSSVLTACGGFGLGECDPDLPGAACTSCTSPSCLTGVTLLTVKITDEHIAAKETTASLIANAILDGQIAKEAARFLEIEVRNSAGEMIPPEQFTLIGGYAFTDTDVGREFRFKGINPSVRRQEADGVQTVERLYERTPELEGKQRLSLNEVVIAISFADGTVFRSDDPALAEADFAGYVAEQGAEIYFAARPEAQLTAAA